MGINEFQFDLWALPKEISTSKFHLNQYRIYPFESSDQLKELLKERDKYSRLIVYSPDGYWFFSYYCSDYIFTINVAAINLNLITPLFIIETFIKEIPFEDWGLILSESSSQASEYLIPIIQECYHHEIIH